MNYKNLITIIMYHYVRPIKKSKYPRVKGLELNSFKKQLDFLSKKYEFITAEQLIANSLGQEKLPKNPCYLTFDDGFKDHIKYVMPELKLRKLQGSFFPPACAIEKKELLDVHAIQFILASTKNYKKLVKDVDQLCSKINFTKSDLDLLKKKWAIPGRYDSKDIRYVKNMLQHVISKNDRGKIVSYLFKKYVGKSTKEFAKELYMSVSDIKKLIKNGMYVGSHGYKHVWLGKESKTDQLKDIKMSLKFLKNVGTNLNNWIMCYPYGSFNKDTLKILRQNKCSIGLTTKVGIANLYKYKILELNRLDTNDFPQ
jgi:peptidoglycan/xylan/chitin deacetylase (PgdA/CDA1 family)